MYKNSLDLARQVEKMGYTRFWLAEHHNMKSIASSATAVLIGYIAGGTSKIRVGSGGIMLPNHSPLIVAEKFGTLGQLYPERIDLGLGRAPGTDQTTAHEIRSDRMQSVHRFPEEVDKIQDYFSIQSAPRKVRAKVAEGVDVPMYILGSSTDSAHLAAKKGLPYVFASHFAPVQLHQALDIYRKEFQASAYLDKPYCIAGINVIVADTTEEAKQLSTSMLRMIVGVLTQKMDYLQKPEAFTKEYEELQSHSAIQQMNKYAFVGDRDKVKAETQKFLESTSVDELMVSSNIYEHEKRVKSYQIFSEIMKS
ncbi:MAG: LLM class flavin-dependent oxidoreductase [Psychroflexus sp.]